MLVETCWGMFNEHEERPIKRIIRIEYINVCVHIASIHTKPYTKLRFLKDINNYEI